MKLMILFQEVYIRCFQAVFVPQNDITVLPNSPPTGSAIVFLDFAVRDSHGVLQEAELKDNFELTIPANQDKNTYPVELNETTAEMPQKESVCFFFYSFQTALPTTDGGAFWENMAVNVDLRPSMAAGDATYLVVVNVDGKYPNCTQKTTEPCENVDPELRFVLPLVANAGM